jgi:hypothetical protein
VHVVVGVVAVIRTCGEDRVEVERVHAEALEVVEFLLDTGEVASEEVAVPNTGLVRVLNGFIPRRVQRCWYGAV